MNHNFDIYVFFLLRIDVEHMHFALRSKEIVWVKVRGTEDVWSWHRVKGRKHLVWDIRKSLFTLLTGEVSRFTKDVGPLVGQDHFELDEIDQESCFDHISSNMYSKQPLDAVDSGMDHLLIL